MIGAALVTAVLVTFASHVDLGFNHGILPNGTACPNVDRPAASCGFSWWEMLSLLFFFAELE